MVNKGEEGSTTQKKSQSKIPQVLKQFFPLEGVRNHTKIIKEFVGQLTKRQLHVLARWKERRKAKRGHVARTGGSRKDIRGGKTRVKGHREAYLEIKRIIFILKRWMATYDKKKPRMMFMVDGECDQWMTSCHFPLRNCIAQWKQLEHRDPRGNHKP